MAKRRKKLNGRVAKIIKSVDSSEPDKAQIEIEGADDLYKEIRIENVVADEKGRRRISKLESTSMSILKRTHGRKRVKDHSHRTMAEKKTLHRQSDVRMSERFAA